MYRVESRTTKGAEKEGYFSEYGMDTLVGEPRLP